DILGQLSVVFVGPGALKKDALRSMFRIRKDKVWRFLVWLKKNNRLYENFAYDDSILEQYEDCEIIPGLLDSAIVDEDLSARDVFEEETAGIDAHPATSVRNDEPGDDPLKPKVFVEHMGVSDPEGDKIPGRTFKVAALRALAAED
ncbi:hypothetical protein FRC01_013463, partial [Tulasnella sp. 417]